MAGRRPVTFFLALLATAAAFQPPKTLPVAVRKMRRDHPYAIERQQDDGSQLRRPRRPRAPVAPGAGKPTGEKEKMSAWETYTDGEYGQAFKFPWEVEASDKTAIGHVIPLVATLAILLPARINAGLDLLPHP